MPSRSFSDPSSCFSIFILQSFSLRLSHARTQYFLCMHSYSNQSGRFCSLLFKVWLLLGAWEVDIFSLRPESPPRHSGTARTGGYLISLTPPWEFLLFQEIISLLFLTALDQVSFLLQVCFVLFFK